MTFSIKRIYEDYDINDGTRVLVDRIWPRGMSIENAHIDIWMKEIAPSTNIRKWYDHIPERFERFKSMYISELESDQTKTELVNRLYKMSETDKITLLYSAKDHTENQAAILKEYLELKKR